MTGADKPTGGDPPSERPSTADVVEVEDSAVEFLDDDATTKYSANDLMALAGMAAQGPRKKQTAEQATKEGAPRPGVKSIPPPLPSAGRAAAETPAAPPAAAPTASPPAAQKSVPPPLPAAAKATAETSASQQGQSTTARPPNIAPRPRTATARPTATSPGLGRVAPARQTPAGVPRAVPSRPPPPPAPKPAKAQPIGAVAATSRDGAPSNEPSPVGTLEGGSPVKRSPQKPVEAVTPGAPMVAAVTASEAMPPVVGKTAAAETVQLPAAKPSDESRPGATKAASKASSLQVAEVPKDLEETLSRWAEPQAQLVREADSLEETKPERAAWMLVAAARIALDICVDPARTDELLSKANKIAPSARAVAASRRWLAQCKGRVAELLDHARAELECASNPRERVEMLGWVAAVEDMVGARRDAAESLLKEACALEPGNLSANLALSGLYARQGRWTDATAGWEQLASHIQDAEVQAGWRAAAGFVREACLNDAAGARVSLERAITTDPTDVFARSALEPILQRTEAWDELCDTLVARAQQHVGDPGTASRLLERAGDVQWEAQQNSAMAAAYYERAATAVPQELGPLQKLAAVLESRGDMARLEDAYQRILQLTHDPSHRASVCFRMGVLYERNQDWDKSLAAYQAALEAMPTFVAAAEGLEALCIRLERWDLLVQLLQAEAERVVSPVHRAARYVRIADLCSSKLTRFADAAKWCERALALDPWQQSAFDLLDRLLRDRGEIASVISIYERSLESARDPRLIRAYQLELATLHLIARRPDRAAVQLKSALSEQQDEFPTLMTLGRALAESSEWAALVGVLEAQARLLTHEAAKVAALFRIAILIETRLADPARALVAYQRVITHSPDHEGALEGMLRIHMIQSRWQEAVGLERRLASLATRPEDAAGRLYRAGWILEQRLGRLDEAIDAYGASLNSLPTYTPASLALERTLRASGSASRLAVMYETRSTTERQPEAKAIALVSAASVYELRLRDLHRAIAALDKALAMCSGWEAAIWAKLRVNEVLCDWRACSLDLQTLLQNKTHPTTRAVLLAHLSRLHEYRLSDSSHAAALMDEALSCGAGRKFLVIDRLRSAQTSGLMPATLRWLGEAASTTSDANWAGAASRQRVLTLIAANASLEDLEDACNSTLAFRQGDTQAIDALASILARRGALAGLANILVRGARQLSHDGTRSLQLFLAGALAERCADRGGAERIYFEALQAQPDCVPALEGLRRLGTAATDWRLVVHACERIGETAAHPLNSAKALIEAGDVHFQQLEDPEAALRMYRLVLSRQPGHVDAFDRAARVTERAGNWRLLTEMLADHATATQDELRKAHLLARRSAVLADRLGLITDAIAEMEAAVRAMPTSTPLLSSLADLYERDSRWQNAIQAYERLAAASSDTAMRQQAQLRQATLLSEQVNEYEAARAILEPLIGECPPEREPYLVLADVYRKLGEPALARNMYRRLAEMGHAAERVEALLKAAEISDRELNDHDFTHVALEQALELAAVAPAVLPSIEEYFRPREAWQRYVALADRVADRVTGNPPGAMAIRLSVARVYRDMLRSPELSEMHLRNTIERFPAATEPRLMLGESWVGTNDKAALTELRAAVQVDPLCVQAYRAIAILCQRMGMPGVAVYPLSACALLGDDVVDLNVPPVTDALPNSLLADESLSLIVGASRARNLRRVVSILDPYLHSIAPPPADILASIIRLPDNHPAAAAVRGVAAALGSKPVAAYQAGDRTRFLLTEARGIVLSNDAAAGGTSGPGVFEASWLIAYAAAGSSLLQGVSHGQILPLLSAATRPEEDGAEKELRKKVFSALPRRSRKELERLLEEEEVNLAAEYPMWEAEERTRALGIAVAVCRDLRAVGQSLVPHAMGSKILDERRAIMSTNEVLMEALRFSVSEPCWVAHQRLFGRR